MHTRIEQRFAQLKTQNRCALITYLMAGDPDFEQSLALMHKVVAAGADIIELGMPFSDPMADGPAIQAAGRRALASKQTLPKTLALVQRFREEDPYTPLLLMGYYNPIYIYGVSRFIEAAKAAGVDGLLIVDLPPEMDAELCIPACKAGLNFIRLATPTSNEDRLPKILHNSSGFIYYVSMTGVTGQALKAIAPVADQVKIIKAQTDLPLAVGFGIKTPSQASLIAEIADGVVIGSALIETISKHIEHQAENKSALLLKIGSLVENLAQAVKSAKRPNP